ncbi:CDP-alcohol phosphatidyltransferase family protein [Caloramator sp. CAR-1]|uniref:CDP-alcohol phosphatidyltransferase family protein n=1 Tax=Caloramator sp. CAR-1 TaxID=3062777 RepID=UPI0026E4077B|nr:CDP-alcohol phosphatidyltransferase family protein [Caloramator sp. CAR-1]MDO6354061.1 CDP-alcohol phosphatidyltransferase family protein [Caloramator sp. CAR-1]
MLDTRARKFVQPLFDRGANFFINLNFNANGVTILAFLIGLFPSIIISFELSKALAVIALWLSGFLDAVDGTLARKTKSSSNFGTLMDIVFDRLVEISLIISLAIKYSKNPYSFLILACSIILSMTIFLTVGAVSEKKGEKSFYYQAGLMERTEGFIMFTLMIVFNKHVDSIALIFALLIFYTAIQRFKEAYDKL